MNAVEGEWSGTVVCAGRYDARSNAARDDRCRFMGNGCCD